MRVDVIHGHNHGKGAFVAGAKLCVVLSDDADDSVNDGDKKPESSKFLLPRSFAEKCITELFYYQLPLKGHVYKHIAI